MIDYKYLIHPLALAVLDAADDYEAYQWMEAGSPVLTDEAKAVLEAAIVVERATRPTEEGIEGRVWCPKAEKAVDRLIEAVLAMEKKL